MLDGPRPVGVLVDQRQEDHLKTQEGGRKGEEGGREEGRRSQVFLVDSRSREKKHASSSAMLRAVLWLLYCLLPLFLFPSLLLRLIIIAVALPFLPDYSLRFELLLLFLRRRVSLSLFT